MRGRVRDNLEVAWLRRTREARRSDPARRISDPEVVCPDRDAAMEEAARRTRDDADDQVEWIYLRNAADQWVARRVQRNPDAFSATPSSRREKAFSPGGKACWDCWALS
jgi:hypothetical protein